MFQKYYVKKTKLTEITGSAYIDNSGSTEGTIMKHQLSTLKYISNYVKLNKFITWSTAANLYNKMPTRIESKGGTNPNCFLEFWNNESFGLIFTDGEINQSILQSFKDNLAEKGCKIPIIIVFTIATFRKITIERLTRNINMSIPEAFLSLSNDVLIALTDGNDIRTMLSKGAFVGVYPSIELTNEMYIDTLLPVCDLSLLEKVIIDEDMPANLIKMPNSDDLYFDLNNIDKMNTIESIDLFEFLCSRALLPRLNLGIVHNTLDNILNVCSANPELDAIREQLYTIAANPKLAGSTQHKELIDTYNKVRTNSKNELNKNAANRINKLKQILFEYQRDSTSFSYGSNRALKANQISENDLYNVGECAQIECPIYMDKGDGYIVFKQPTLEDYVQAYTSNFYMDSPFELGNELVKWTTPGIFCNEVVTRMNKNPYTREDIIGYIPLSTEPHVVMRHLSKVFGGRKELWHFVRAYCGLLTSLAEKPWMQDYKDILKDTLVKLMDNYMVSDDLSLSIHKCSLTNAFKKVTHEYSVCLRDRFYNDIKTICKIVDFSLPLFVYPKDKIVAMAEFIHVFDKMLKLYKQGEQMIQYVMEVDEYGHYVTYKGGLNGLVAQVFWHDKNEAYKLYKLQLAINKSFGDKKFGTSLQEAFNGNTWNELILECAIPGLDATKFEYEEWTPDGLSTTKCAYTGKVFDTSKELFVHIKQLLGPRFFNGHRAVRNVMMNEVRNNNVNLSTIDIFKLVKQRLYKAYGEQSKLLHTVYAKNILLYFIKKFKEQMHITI